MIILLIRHTFSMYKNFVVALAIVLITGTGLFATSASALTADDVQLQIKQLLAQVSELTARLNALRTQMATMTDPSIGVSITPTKIVEHRICGVLNRNLTQGAQGDDVRGLQEFLYQQKMLTVAPTGYFGSMTAEAVRKWQANEGVSAVGSFGPLSRERIKMWCGGGWNNSERFSASPTRGDAPMTVVFDTWLSGFRVNTISYAIDFGDGSSERAADCPAPADACTGPGQNKHTYAQNGTYVAMLNKITNPCAGMETTCKAAIRTEVVAKQQISVGPVACTKEYKPVCGAQPIVCITTPCNPIPTTYGNRCEMNADNATLLYEGQCRDTVADPANDPRCKAWYDGCNSCSRNSAGEPAMCTLRACMAEMMAKPYCTAWFDTANKPPTVSSFSGPTTLKVNTSGTWTIQASDPENGQLSYQIWWGDENVYASPLASSAPSSREFVQSTTFTHSYASAGTYTVTIVVRDAAGNEAKTSSTVKVESANTVCADIYQPVCGRPSGCMNTCAPGMYCAAMCQMPNPVTYGNRCSMEAAGASYLHEGQCTATSGNWY